MRMRTAVAVLLVCPGAAWAQVPLGPEFQINTFTTGNQVAASVAADAAGNFTVVWSSGGVDGSSTAIVARRYDAAGVPLGGSEFRVNAYTTGYQQSPALAVDPAGAALVVVWESGHDGASTGVFGRRYDINGTGAEFKANTYTTGQQSFVDVAHGDGGNFVVVWTSDGPDGSGRGIFGQRYTPTAAGPEFRVNSFTTLGQERASVSAAPDGRFVVVWHSDGQDGSGRGVFGQRYDAAGAPAGGEFRVNASTTGYQAGPAVAMRGDGSFVVVWGSPLVSGYEVVGRRFSAAGAPLGSDFLVNQYTTNGQFLPGIAVGEDGSFVVVWTSVGQDGSNYGVFGRSFDASGTPQGGDFLISTYTTDRQQYPSVAAQGGGRFVVTWVSLGQDGSGSGVFGQRFAADLIFRDGFESNSLSSWSSAATDGGDLGLSPDAAMDFTGVGLRGLVDDQAGLYVQDDRPADENRYRARFYFDPNGFDPGTAQAHLRTRIFLVFEEAPNRRVAAVVLRKLSGVYSLMLRCRRDDDSQDNGGFFTISDAPHAVELDWKRSSGPDALDGSCRLSIDGVEVSARTGLDNSISAVDFVRMGALSVKTGAAGVMHWDEFESRRLNPIGP